jgi:hypothetical protein
VKQSTTTKMKSNELDCGRSMMKSMEIEDHGKQGTVMVEKIHEGNDEDSLHEHKHHMNPQILSQTSKVMATNSHETLIPWSC